MSASENHHARVCLKTRNSIRMCMFFSKLKARICHITNIAAKHCAMVYKYYRIPDGQTSIRKITNKFWAFVQQRKCSFKIHLWSNKYNFQWNIFQDLLSVVCERRIRLIRIGLTYRKIKSSYGNKNPLTVMHSIACAFDSSVVLVPHIGTALRICQNPEHDAGCYLIRLSNFM